MSSLIESILFGDDTYLLTGSCNYYYYSSYSQSFEAADVILLRTEKWLVNTAGDFVSTSEITRDEIASTYDTSSENVSSLFNFLQIFSKFVYGGILKHNRTADSAKPLNVDYGLNISALNIVKFPVTKYESITRSKRLQHSSSYHIYSALFSFEFTSFLADNIARANAGTQRNFTIGIIAPYRAQADLIDKLMASANLPASVSVQVGTIHGFQGDECDIIIAVFNAPPSISSSKEMFLNKKNIINVSISRARDYLFIVMPDDDTENVDNLRLVKRVERLAKEEHATEWHSHELEKLMFGTGDYLEENTFSTGHQSVNVYGLPEKTYEIRSEDTAVDVQVHRNVTVQTPHPNQPVADKQKPLPASADMQQTRTEKKRGDVVSKKYGDGYVVKRTINAGKT